MNIPTMFLSRRFLSSSCALSLPSLCRFSSSVSVSSGLPRPPRRDYMANSDCRAVPLRDRVAFLIRLSDLDTAAKHARLAPFAENDKEYAVDWVCGAIIVAMCKAKRYRDALDLIRYFFNEHKMIPPKGSFNHVLKGVLDDSSNATKTLLKVKRLAQAGSFDEAMDSVSVKGCMRQIKPFGMCLDVSNSLIRELLDLGKFKEALKLFGEIKIKDDHNRAAVASATFMEYWFKKGKEDEAMECYNNLLATKLTKIESTGSIALLKVLLKYDKKTQAWALFHHLVDSDRQTKYEFVDSDKLNPIMVNECFKMGQIHAAIQTFKIPMADPDASGLRNIITCFCELGLLKEADHFFAKMPRDCTPDVSTYKALMDAYVKAGRVDDILQISNHMVDASLSQVAKVSCLFFQQPQ
ncbi:pentatricopeptide repeat-containing protein At3g60980, mitochondrial [Arabidopsis lyrata subsp. lyrata]|uniref:pentatricopeptide repeat-containing protein At3g60980, mitochondrial n=1 Tax=Arabidopsis lyrata subsp. lyrata TaxID=81972 RepID=UPI000A29A5BE|nr:pentatricopeptide repeat-containing protein At3g60980, mitochondrial [Arabidopsis lyrata subsp. lyrata]|eukprot:XP_020886680.1 pentatricopeptide repeat-containing protein At3g60980, mitochondrial [Arabidopsis lyrata subsp. lyrata]